MTSGPAYRRLLGGGAMIVMANGTSAALGLLLLFILARSLPPEGLAIVVAIIAVIDGGQMMLDASVNTGMINLSSRDGRKGAPSLEILRAGFWSKLGLGLIFALVIATFATPMSVALVDDDRLWLPLVAAGGAAVAAGLASFVLGVLTSHEQFGRIAVLTLMKNSLRIAVVLPFVLREDVDPRALALAVCAAAGLLALIAGGFISWRFLRSRAPLWPSARALFGVNGWLLLAALAMLGGRLDLWVVGWLAGAEAAGLYAVASQVCVGVGILTQAMVTVLLPSVSRFTRPDEMKAFLWRTARVGLPLLLLPLLAWPLAEPVLVVVFGPAYAGSAGVFVVLLEAALMTMVGAPLMLILLSLGEARIIGLASLLQLGARIGLAVMIVPALGAVGMAWADVISRIAISALAIGVILRQLDRHLTPVPAVPVRADV